jgi:hypothetical protein
MEVSKKGKAQITFPGDLTVENQVNAKNLNVSENTVFEGDITVKGKIIAELPSAEPKYENVVNLGDPEQNGSWRLFVDNDGMLHIQKLENGEWEVKQTLL